MKSITIIGAGLSGLVLGKLLSEQKNYHVDILEKSRGVGGRMATRYIDEYEFDHGAQYFTVKTKEFAYFLKPYINNKVIGLWNFNFVDIDNSSIELHRKWDEDYAHYVGTPRMTSLAKDIAKNLNVHLNQKVSTVKRKNKKWEVFVDDKYIDSYDYLVTCAPPEQATTILPNNISYYDKIQNIKMLPCFALLIGYKDKITFEWEAAHINNQIISWISVNSSKPGRLSKPSVTVISTNEWAQNHFEFTDTFIKSRVLDEYIKITKNKEPSFVDLKRWRYANTNSNTNQSKLYFDKDNKVASCGDWCINGRIESAFTSAYRLYKEITLCS